MNTKNNDNFDFEQFFDNVITKGRIEKEREVVQGLTIRLRPLDADEQISAESISVASNLNMPIDTVEKIRAISMLSKAIIAVNGVKVFEEDDDSDIKSKKSEALYKKLLSLPSHVIDSIYVLYAECVGEQRNLYKDGLQNKIENF